MAQDIIQHHQPFDFDKFFKDETSKYINIDYNDYQTFFKGEGEVHSFISESDSDYRVKDAIANAIASNDAGRLLGMVKAAMIILVHSRNAQRPLALDEIQAVTEFVSNLPDSCDVVWGTSQDQTIGNTVKVMLLVRI